jgi:AcrR family transcriptional regulator
MPTSRAQVGLDPETIVDTAIRLIDELGADAVTVRRLASELNVTAPVVYWHVGNKDALWNAVTERVFSELPIPSKTLGWQDQVRHYMADAWAHLLQHPGVLELASMSRVAWTGSAAQWGTEGFRIMQRAGFDDIEAAVHGQALMLQIIGMARLEAGMATHTPVLEPWVDERGRLCYRVKPELLPDDLPVGARRMSWLDVLGHRELMIDMTITALRSARRRRLRTGP